MQTIVFENTLVVIKRGNLVNEQGDAIVCPSNSFGHMRGGIAASIRESGGENIEEEAIARAPVEVGNAVITTAGRLKVKHIIHAPTMKFAVGRASIDSVRKAVNAALSAAVGHHFSSVTFPGMGTESIANEEAARVILEEIRRHLEKESATFNRIGIIAHSDEFYKALKESALMVFR